MGAIVAMYTHKLKMKKDDELANAITEAEAKAPEDLTEQDKMALLGRPKAGDIIRAQLRIKESKEFKVNTFSCCCSFFPPFSSIQAKLLFIVYC